MAYIQYLICPTCRTEFEAGEWEDGCCPKCNERYTWDEFVAEDYSDRYVEPIWESIYGDRYIYDKK